MATQRFAFASNYAGIDPGTTQRLPSTSLFTVDSEDRWRDYPESRLLEGRNSDPYDFSIYKGEALLNGYFTRIGLTEVVFPWVIGNVNRRTDRVLFGWSDPSGTFSQLLVLPQGFYTPARLASTLQTLVRALSPYLAAFTITYGIEGYGSDVVDSPIFQYRANAGLSVSVWWEPLPYNSSAYPYPSTSKQLFDVLGLTTLNQQAFATTGAVSGFTYCQAIRYIDITAPIITYNQALKDGTSQTIVRDSLCRVYVADSASMQSTVPCSSASFCPPGCAPTTIYRNFATPKYVQWAPNQPIPGVVQFQVFDDTGAPLSQSVPAAANGNRTDWSMTLLVSEN